MAAKTIAATLQQAVRVKQYTLAFLLRDHQGEKQVLLGMKKRGFGEGKWNGFGGKVEPSDKTIEDAAAREMTEEASIEIHGKDMERMGTLVFTFKDKPEVMQVHVFQTRAYSGSPAETDEMRPQWYGYDTIPYTSMWSDDSLWLPHLLKGHRITGQFDFADDETTIVRHVLDVDDVESTPNTN
ncbi:hypothetical protein H310_00892 [Aphanomyces invadans]|uniref:Oxidized purine nucleoside triphosphate hydrolase n=1 Tax=Aphanomyces invadans TaxID=157072 RepID=A0A024UP77_9STRA|nr:hypothetical protein H310_00892 [Aphanomyces invadans]ETW08261.1 hypothetical protein H310_00892 [Aphanomyces invadans]|eukprot:XP_008862066.1 hypothetical protein H310_00892 [Aphanomyces invadans]